jgi:hypothetical protein
MPDELTSTFGEEPSITATTEFVVPRSIPMILAIIDTPFDIYIVYLMIDCWT